MAYDDRPLYEQAKMDNVTVKADSNQGLVKPRPADWSGRMASTAILPSQLLLWWETERAKQARGEFNEIDLAEIWAASKGVKNRWYERYTKDEKRFEPIIHNRPFNWDEIK